ncbi:MAG: hypothetical protein R3301_03255 [Saprospiraceae bacterium]|nr:hypothetical protein [Saprospiraceae bacterium]
MSPEKRTKITINGIVGILVFVMIAILFVMITGGILRLLYSWLPLVLFAGALIVNYETVLKYIRFLINRFRTNAMNGVVAIILTVLFYPFVAAFLFGKAFLDRKIKRLDQARRQEQAFVEYEDVTDQEESLDLKPLKEADEHTSYDEFLDDHAR